MAALFDPHAYDALVNAACSAASISIPLVRACCQQESSWDALRVGDNGSALGLMQVHRIAAEDVGMANDWQALGAAITAKDANTAAQLSLKIGTAYLAKMLKDYSAAEPWALAAYNQGPTVVNAFRLGQHYAESVLALKGTA